MILKAEAVAIVTSYLAKLSVDAGMKLGLVESATLEHSFGWVFFYQSEAFLESGNFSDRLAGNSPLIVDCKDGSLHETGTAYAIEVYLNRYEKFGNPHYKADCT